MILWTSLAIFAVEMMISRDFYSVSIASMLIVTLIVILD